jgi:hypothetical protein
MVRSRQQFVIEQGFNGGLAEPSLYNALMFQPRAVGTLVAAGAAIQSPWLFAGLAAALWWSAAVPAHNPFDAVYNAVLARRVGVTRLASGTAPRRFAAALAGALALAIAASLTTGATRIGGLLEGAFGAAVASVVLVRFCPGAWLYRALSQEPAAAPAEGGRVGREAGRAHGGARV